MKIDWKPVLIAFAFGMFFGAAVADHLDSMGHKHWGGPGKFREKMMNRFTSELKLDAQQQEKVGKIMEDTRLKIDTFRQQTQPQFESVKKEAQSEIRALLNPGQQVKFDQLSVKMEERRKQWRAKKAGWGDTFESAPASK